MNGLSIYFYNLGLLSFISLLFLLIGQQFQQVNKLTFRTTFFSLFFGVIFLSTFFAVIKTGGKTIMLGYILLAVFYFFEKKNAPILSIKPYSSNLRFIIIGLLFGAAFVFTWSFLSIGQFDSFPYYIPGGTEIAQNDYIINVFRSYYLGATGEENYYHFFNTVDEAYHGPKPYHYLEMWTTAVLTSIFGGLAAETFALVMIPLYHLMAFIGILALWEKYQAVKWYHLILSASFLFFAGLHFQFYEQWNILNFSLPIFTHRVKMCVYYPFIFAFLLQFDKEKPQQAILVLLGLILATVVVAPALLGGIALFLAYQFIIANNKSGVIKTAGYITTIALFVFLFYKFMETGQFNIRANAGANNVVINLLTSLTTAPLEKLVTLWTILLQEGILYLPLLLLALLLFSIDKKLFANHFPLFILILGIVLSGASIYTLLKGQKDATQLFYNMANATLNCLLIWVVIKLISQLFIATPFTRLSWKHYGIGLVCIVIGTKQIPYAIKRNIYPAMTAKKYSDDYLHQIKTISDFDIPNLKWEDQLDRASNLFCRFVETQKAAKEFVSIGQSQVDFIKKYNLDFVIISKNGTLRQELQAIVKDRIIDEVSGEYSNSSLAIGNKHVKYITL